MKYLQVKDLIKMWTDKWCEVQILWIPNAPGQPWVVKEVETGNKWRIHTSGMFSRTTTS